jgi:signal transduction histidine kinase
LKRINENITQDLELQKIIEESLRQSLEKSEILTKLLLETIPNGVLLLDPLGKILLVNDYLRAIFRSISNFELVPSLTLDKIPRSILIEFLEASYETYVLTNLEQNKSKYLKKTLSLENHFHYEAFFSSLINPEDGTTWGYLCVLHDVTPFVELDLMRKNFISTVSHELRTPISSLSLTLENMIRFKDRLTAEQRDQMMGMMNKNTKILAEMIEDLLITSRIDNEKLKINRELINVSPILNDIFLQLDGKIHEKNVTIIKDFPDSIEINADPKRISQIFRIFIDNAIKYSPTNSNIKILVTEDIANNGYSFSISDSGIGIPEKDLPQIFKRFYRASNTISIQGTGLGLSIAKDLIEKHGGHVKLESWEGKGTTITAFLPKT